jgi:hypothetical protein
MHRGLKKECREGVGANVGDGKIHTVTYDDIEGKDLFPYFI